MMNTSPMFESEAARGQVHGRRWLSFQKRFGGRVGKATDYAHDNGRSYQTCLPMNALATDARAPVTNSKHCGSDWLLHKLLTSMFWTVAMVPPVIVITSIHAGTPTHILLSAIATISMPKDQSWLVCRRLTWLLAASSDSNLGEMCIIGFLKVCSLLCDKI